MQDAWNSLIGYDVSLPTTPQLTAFIVVAAVTMTMTVVTASSATTTTTDGSFGSRVHGMTLRGHPRTIQFFLSIFAR